MYPRGKTNQETPSYFCHSFIALFSPRTLLAKFPSVICRIHSFPVLQTNMPLSMRGRLQHWKSRGQRPSHGCLKKTERSIGRQSKMYRHHQWIRLQVTCNDVFVWSFSTCSPSPLSCKLPEEPTQLRGGHGMSVEFINTSSKLVQVLHTHHATPDTVITARSSSCHIFTNSVCLTEKARESKSNQRRGGEVAFSSPTPTTTTHSTQQQGRHSNSYVNWATKERERRRRRSRKEREFNLDTKSQRTCVHLRVRVEQGKMWYEWVMKKFAQGKKFGPISLKRNRLVIKTFLGSVSYVLLPSPCE